MKVWVKLLLGSALGLVLGFLAPVGDPVVTGAIAWAEGLAIRLGRYLSVPVLFFSLVVAIYELREDRRFWPFLGSACLALAGLSALVIALGMGATLIFPPDRIPILIEEEAEAVALNLGEGVLEIFPSNMFAVFTGEGVYILPLCIFAFFLAMGLSFDRNYTKPVIALFDSFSRIFYHITAFFSELLGLVMIALAAYWAVCYRGILPNSGYRGVIILTLSLSLVLGFAVLPAFLYLARPAVNPWRIMYASLGPAIAAFFSGDMAFTMPTLYQNAKENLGLRRRANAVSIPFFTSFGRAGSAMVATVAFLVILKSYSSLNIAPEVLFAVGGRAFVLSLLLARQGGQTAYIALTLLCLEYGRGFESGYLILKPLAFFLTACGALLDVQITTFASCFISRRAGFQEEREIRHFV